ncbi:Aste57867_4307 [Aphanomyces stellatus]|uniref:Aste57867_4307 protein n=1 Tax=Aphanomyces stellatus TaxID=120398 RepID=A0A485KCE7_9STRA|nr:hypothetical protein As57867_004296 [Aphanomyces stellatus]VFT81422.1 Aste57867_4307 [Aphanomyces stellatus]
MGDRASTVPVALATNEDERVVDLDSLLAQRDYVRDDDDVVETAHEYTPGSPPSSTLMAKRPNQSGSQEKLKKKLKIEPPKKGLNLAESVFKGMKIRVDAQAEMSRALVDSKAKEFEYKVEQDARQLAIKQKDVALQQRSLRHSQIMEEGRLMASIGYSKEAIMEYVKDELSKLP